MSNVVQFPGKGGGSIDSAEGVYIGGLGRLAALLERLGEMLNEGKFDHLDEREINDIMLVVPSEGDGVRKLSTVVIAEPGSVDDFKRREFEIVRDCYRALLRRG